MMKHTSRHYVPLPSGPKCCPNASGNERKTPSAGAESHIKTVFSKIESQDECNRTVKTCQEQIGECWFARQVQMLARLVFCSERCIVHAESLCRDDVEPAITDLLEQQASGLSGLVGQGAPQEGYAAKR